MMNSFFGFGLGWPEVLMIMVICLILFGAKKIPELARGLGQGIKEFKRATSDLQDQLQRSIEEEPPRAPTPKVAAPAEILPSTTPTIATSESKA